MAGNGSLDAVRRDVRAAALLGVTGTPTSTRTEDACRHHGRAPQGNRHCHRRHRPRSGRAGNVPGVPAADGTQLVPEIDRNAAAFLAQLKKEGTLVSAGQAEGTGGAAGFKILTIRADNAADALKLISQSPDVAGGIVKVEVVEFRPTDLIAR